MEDYKEKLRLAKEALDSGSYDKETIEYIFPELKESEDKRIRKQTLKVLNYYKDEEKSEGRMPTEIEECIAWLEKQSNEPNWCHHKVDLSDCSEEYRKAYYDGWNNCNMQHSQCKSELDDVLKCLINGMKFYYEDSKDATWGTDKWSMPVKHIIEVLEKQGEHKPTDKVEQKFKVGDWVVYGNEDVDLITGLCDKGYEVNACAYIPFGCEDDMRYWTIQDAKKGDILSYDKSKCIAMFLKIESVSFKDICYIGAIDGKFHIGSWHDIEKAHPATQEQRDLLFAKMKEARYEWDAEKKELRKIEQKPAWSEEDKEMLDFAIRAIGLCRQYAINNQINGYSKLPDVPKKFEELQNWLKSKLCPQPHWKPSDESFNNTSCTCLSKKEAESKVWKQ